MLENTPTRNTKDSNRWGVLNDLHLRRISIPVITQYWPDRLVPHQRSRLV